MNAQPQASFVMVLPPGWVRLPASDEQKSARDNIIDAVIDDALPDTLPRDRAEPWRGELRKKLTASVVEAGQNGATAVYLPVRAINGVAIPASIIESEIEDEGASDVYDSSAVVRALLAPGDPDALTSRVMVDGAVAVRSDALVSEASPTPRADLLSGPVSSRQVVYTIEVPHRAGRWVVLSFSVISGEGPATQLADSLVLLFDALVTTFRWTDVLDQDQTALQARLEQIHSF